MNTYLATEYMDSEGIFFSLFKINPSRKSQRKENGRLVETEYTIIAILFADETKLIIKETLDHTFQWKWKNTNSCYHSSEYHRGVLANNGMDSIIELPDDESALLWFKLEYGG